MSKIRCISETPEVTKIFEELLRVKPSNINFSKVLSIAAQEYIERNNGKVIKTDESIKLFDKMDKIRKLINEAKGEDLIKIQRRHQQIGTLLNMRVSRLL